MGISWKTTSKGKDFEYKNSTNCGAETCNQPLMTWKGGGILWIRKRKSNFTYTSDSIG